MSHSSWYKSQQGTALEFSPAQLLNSDKRIFQGAAENDQTAIVLSLPALFIGFNVSMANKRASVARLT